MASVGPATTNGDHKRIMVILFKVLMYKYMCIYIYMYVHWYLGHGDAHETR